MPRGGQVRSGSEQVKSLSQNFFVQLVVFMPPLYPAVSVSPDDAVSLSGELVLVVVVAVVELYSTRWITNTRRRRRRARSCFTLYGAALVGLLIE